MNLLLDSHVVAWWLAGGSMLSRPARRSIDTAERLLISPISYWEIASLASRGRLTLDRDVYAWTAGLQALPRVARAELSPEIAVTAGLLDRQRFAGDPADRLLYATAKELGVPFCTRDTAIQRFAEETGDVRTVW